MEVVFQYIGLATAIFTAIAAFSAYNIYRLGKRDAKLSLIRASIIEYRHNCDSLDQIITFELIHELADSAIYSKQLVNYFKDIYSTCFEIDIDNEEALSIIKNFGPISTPIYSPLQTQFEQILKRNTDIASLLWNSPKGLYRVCECANLIFNSFLRQTKRFLQNEDIYRDAISQVYNAKDELKIRKIADLQQAVFIYLCNNIAQVIKERFQLDINDIKSLITLLSQKYLGLSDKELYSHLKRDKKLTLKDPSETNTIFEDLIESEKRLKSIMSEDEILKFRELSTCINVRNRRDD